MFTWWMYFDVKSTTKSNRQTVFGPNKKLSGLFTHNDFSLTYIYSDTLYIIYVYTLIHT